MTAPHVTEEPTTDRWSALGGVLLSALYLWVVLWLLLAVLVPSIGLGWRPVVITSGSMAPLIRPGDVVLSAEAVAVEPGQVITYEDPARDGTLTTHRIVSVDDDGSIRTQGDANPTPDSTVVPPENVLGRGRLLVPLVGLPLLWLSGGAVLFGLWVVVTAVSVAVVAGATGSGGPPPPTTRSGGGSVTGPLLRLADRARPGRVQQIVVRALVRRAHGPDGPQLAIDRWQRGSVRPGHAAGAVLPARLSGRVVVAMAMLVAVAAATVGRSAATFSAAADSDGSSFAASAAFPTDDLTLYLQNDPEGEDTVDRRFLPMTGTVPTQAVLPNYDTDVDGDPGLRIESGGADQYETDGVKVQRWTHTPSDDLAIASARIVFHSASAGFLAGEDATVTWFLRHCDEAGADCVEVASATVSAADWSAGASGFVERTASLAPVSHVVPAGRQLELAVIAPSATTDLWFAYDTAGQPSRLELVAPTAGACPGSGSSVQHVRGDTRVEEDRPTTNFATARDLEVTSKADRNARTLLTVALPVVPDGCTITTATLHLEARTSQAGRTILAQRTDTTVDPATVTWADQPTASGTPGSGRSPRNGPTPIDVLAPVRDLYALGNTGLQLRDSVEDDTATSNLRFHSSESRPDPDPEGPRLEVTWGP